MWELCFKQVRRRHISLIIAVMISAGVLSKGLCADDVADVIVLKATLWSEHTQNPVTFSHKKHSDAYENDCAECHHIYTEGTNTWIEGDPVAKCQECHNEPTVKDENKLSPQKQKINLKRAFHNSCRACHTKFKKQNPTKYEKIPTECDQCHKAG